MVAQRTSRIGSRTRRVKKEPLAGDAAAIRGWAANLGKEFIHGAALLDKPDLRIALDGFATGAGLAAQRQRRADLVRELTEIADDGVLGPEQVDLSLPAVWGPPVTEQQRESAESENLRRAFKARQAVVESSISRSEVAELIQVSEQAVTKQLARGRMIGLKVRGQWAIPTWQLDPNNQDGILPGVEELNQGFPGGPVALSRWMTTPAADFADQTPRDLLAANRVDEVICAAAGLTAAGW